MTALSFPNLWIPQSFPALCPSCGKFRFARQRIPWWKRWRDSLSNPFGLVRPAAGDVLVDSAGNVILDGAGKVRLDDGTGCGCCTSSSGCFNPGCSLCQGAGLFPNSARITFTGVQFATGCNDLIDSCNGNSPESYQVTSGFLGSYCLISGAASNCNFNGGTGTAGNSNPTMTLNTYAGLGCIAPPDAQTIAIFVNLGRLDASTWLVQVTAGPTFISGGTYWLFCGTVTGITDCTRSFQVRNDLSGPGEYLTLGSGALAVTCPVPCKINCARYCDYSIAVAHGGSALIEMCC